MWYLLTAHQQESFLPFSSQQSLSCCLSRVAKRSTPKTHGPSTLLQNLVVLFLSFRTTWSFLFTPEPCGPLFTSEPRGPVLSPQNRMVLFFPMAARPRFKSQCPSSFSAPFLTPPTVSYTCQHPRILLALLGCHCKSGQLWPHGV